TLLFIFLFFFQAEDGIRDPLVTGVQTCALPIWRIEPRVVMLKLLACTREQLEHDNPGLDSPRLAGSASGQDGFEKDYPRGDGEEIGRASCRERGEVGWCEVALKGRSGEVTVWGE